MATVPVSSAATIAMRLPPRGRRGNISSRTGARLVSGTAALARCLAVTPIPSSVATAMSRLLVASCQSLDGRAALTSWSPSPPSRSVTPTSSASASADAPDASALRRE
nr:hypothetical protein GCM10025732_03620 [Glycomyces mayteni]